MSSKALSCKGNSRKCFGYFLAARFGEGVGIWNLEYERE